jgi:hypothetical protein
MFCSLLPQERGRPTEYRLNHKVLIENELSIQKQDTYHSQVYTPETPRSLSGVGARAF